MSTFTDSALLVRSNPAALLALGASEQLGHLIPASTDLALCLCWEQTGEFCSDCWSELLAELGY